MSQRPLYPLQFRPHFKQYLWGGRGLGEVLGKPIGDGPSYAESWEVVDHGEDQSVVLNGPLADLALHQLVVEYGEQLFGTSSPSSQFPLLLKFLDAQKNLSLQVHPNDAYGATMNPPDLGKTEAWVVMHAAPDSVIYAGLKRGFDRAAFARELSRGTGHLCAHQIRPQIGDCIFIPAGAVHAIGAGLLIAEIQQASNTTFRLYDWNRVGPDGQPRPLHLDRGLDVTDYDLGPIEPQQPQATERAHVERLVECDKFVLDRWTVAAGSMDTIFPADDRFHIVTVLQGTAELNHPEIEAPLERGQTVLLPAVRESLALQLSGDAILLDMWIAPK
jgi:mannose-6-phosphate isomerase